ncbi:MOSC domain-containing protein [Dactylosporangium roseum]|uniref:MOSC domain-containing protein n=1 Tax=Dactylosporangium roseum TaxID=47989 RepID=A0ABY5ZB50_9ACTN|nr:MOSC domain-containing protein [Dactylosporangium roseum]UWZ39251.1 MOSC domain-containing protein [Dactylosporangium roseum]
MGDYGAVLSVNAGAAAPMRVQGDTIVSGFVKTPTDQVRRIEVGGLAGDDHVDDADDPDRAVLCYQRRHYDAWSEELGRELAPGMFGEQLTIDGPAEADIRVGDLLRVGSALLAVTQPRIPCRKMAVRLGQDDMPVRYMRSGRVGFFCKVLQPGDVRAGDGIELVRRGPDELTVAQLAAVLHSDEPDPALVGRVLQATVLPELVRAKLTRLLDRAAAQARSWSGDRPLLVTARTPYGSEVVAFDLVDPAGERLPDFEPGQFLTLVLDVPGREQPVVRTYTIAERTADSSGYRVAVKREPSPEGRDDVPPGLASTHLHDNVAVGATITARAPRGKFVLRPGRRPVALVSAGIGITPMMAMLEHLATADPTNGARTPDPRKTYFVHAARSSRELTFGQRVRELVSDRPHLHSHLLFSRPRAEDIQGRDYDAAGRLTAQTLQQIVPDLDADFYLCGPTRFMADIAAGLVGLGVPQGQVNYEFFGAASSLFGDPDDQDAGSEAVDSEGRPILVTFARSGITVAWRENTFSLLACAEQAGLRPDASCRTGLCNTCVARIDDGQVDYVIEPMDPVTPGKVAVCCTRPRTSVMIDL